MTHKNQHLIKKKKEKIIKYIENPKKPIQFINNAAFEIQRLKLALKQFNTTFGKVYNATEMCSLHLKDCLEIMIKAENVGNNNTSEK